MKTLKLQVGKTYRSRSGEEVKIVGMGNKGWDYWEGSNGEWYYEGGKWSYVSKEHPEDLIEEVPEPTRHTFDIPDGVKKVTVEQVGNRIVVEMVPTSEPKPGDVMINEKGSVYILKEVVGINAHKYYACLGRNGQLSYHHIIIAKPGRPATPEEAQPLLDALKKEGKQWNPETMQVEEIPEFDRLRELTEGFERYLKYKEGEK